tara:strand:- start:639 stop:1112 length:474 start_codon:yes stop_codon:yes gene_type:complete
MNGRVNIVNVPNNSVFSLYDKIPVGNTSYGDALTGNWTSNLLSKAYFSAENIQIIQNGVKAYVYNNSSGKYLISKQNEDTLKIIMRSIFLQHAKNRPDKIPNQIEKLNNIVVGYCGPKVLGEAEGYINYKRDISTLAVPMNRPVSTYHSNTLENKNF